MFSINKHTKTTSKPKPTCQLCVCVSLCTTVTAENSDYFPPNLQTIITALMLSKFEQQATITISYLTTKAPRRYKNHTPKTY